MDTVMDKAQCCVGSYIPFCGLGNLIECGTRCEQMARKYIALIVLLVWTGGARAQYVKDKRVGYEGFVELGNALSLNDTPFSLFGIEAVHRIWVKEEGCDLFLGVGAGAYSVHFVPYARKLTGDLTPEMFHYDLRRRVCPAVSVHAGARFPDIRKLRKRMIPFVKIRLSHLWNNENTSTVQIDRAVPGTLLADVSSIQIEWTGGTELRLGSFPRLYMGLGWMVFLGSLVQGGCSLDEGADDDAGRKSADMGGCYKIKMPAVFSIKIGVHLWGGK